MKQSLFCAKVVLLFFLTFMTTASAQAGDSFLWGVANSAFQVEGSPVDSDLYRETHTPGWVKDGTNADIATDFWNRYDEDFTLAQNLGANGFRISLAWERLEISRGEWNEAAMQHYEKIIADMRAHGIEPIITLYHNVLPVWVSDAGGVSGSTFPQVFAEYAAHVVGRLSQGTSHVKYWLTLNEPTTYAEGSYTSNSGSISKFFAAIDGQANGHIAAYQAIHALPNGADLKVGYAQDWEDFEAKHKWNPMDDLANAVTDRIYNRGFLGRIDKVMPGRKPALDFLGINYYNRSIVNFTVKGFVATNPGPGPKSDMGVEVYAPGFEIVLKHAAHYGLPILITENGVPDAADRLRPQFLVDHIHYLLKARDEDHIPIFGYMHWSLTDNFEWNSGLSIHYGLVEVNYSTLVKTPRESYFTYQKLIQEDKAKNN
jgi:beta-glucosidase